MTNREKQEYMPLLAQLTDREGAALCASLRKELVEDVAKTGGHLASNLGAVELTVAIHRVFDTRVDRLVFDVGHQSYVHKILTGRAKDFATLRQYGGLSGYINRNESKYDIWESGHSSTTISAMSGIILADEDKDSRVLSIIGDSSIMNGVALEGLNFLGQMKDKNPIIILNDNKMGISKSVGALSKTFSKLRGSKFYTTMKAINNKIFPIICFGHIKIEMIPAYNKTVVILPQKLELTTIFFFHKNVPPII